MPVRWAKTWNDQQTAFTYQKLIFFFFWDTTVLIYNCCFFFFWQWYYSRWVFRRWIEAGPKILCICSCAKNTKGSFLCVLFWMKPRNILNINIFLFSMSSILFYLLFPLFTFQNLAWNGSYLSSYICIPLGEQSNFCILSEPTLKVNLVDYLEISNCRDYEYLSQKGGFVRSAGMH